MINVQQHMTIVIKWTYLYGTIQKAIILTGSVQQALCCRHRRRYNLIVLHLDFVVAHGGARVFDHFQFKRKRIMICGFQFVQIQVISVDR